jgi:hypothetical protein
LKFAKRKGYIQLVPEVHIKSGRVNARPTRSRSKTHRRR